MNKNSQYPMEDEGLEPSKVPEDSSISMKSGVPSNCGLILLLIVLAYLFIGSLYAFLTPPWQVPDEPAHYNYIRQLAEESRLPILEPGDYNQDFLERIVSKKFPPSLPIKCLEYEDHQPPLYYLLAVPVHLAGDGSLRVLRLFSLTVGAGIILFAFAIARRLYPEQPLIAIGAAAFIAFLPQHNAMMAGVNNDCLAELFIAAVLFLSLQLVQEKNNVKQLLILGVVLGLGLITKATVYSVVPVALAAVWFRWRLGENKSALSFLQSLFTAFAPALLITVPWWIRNGMLYGWPDILGLMQHNFVVEGQPRTAEWIASRGWDQWLWRGLLFTFQSFWAQFGWMSVVLDFRIYFALLLLTTAVLFALIWPERKNQNQSLYNRHGMPGKKLLLLQFVLTFLLFLAYNSIFVQHQGRYLYPALIPIAIGFTTGIFRTALGSFARGAIFFMLFILALLVIQGAVSSDLKGWFILIAGIFTAVLRGISLLPEKYRILAFGVPFGVMFLINLHFLLL